MKNIRYKMKHVTVKKAILTILILLIPTLYLTAQEQDWETFYEKSNYLETPRFAETVAYCQRLADASDWIDYSSFGISPQGRELPLLVVDKNGNFDPASVKASGNLILLVEAGIHPGEIDGKDAGLMFIRDMVIHDQFPELLENITLLFIPILNVDGHERFGPYNRINQNGPEEMGWRTTAQNLNLNRDFLKADAPEMQAWLQLFSHWLPDFFVDIHATDGADFQYVITYILEIYGNMDQGLTDWTDEEFIPFMTEEMYKRDYPIFRYVGFRNWFDPESGISSSPSGPRYSSGYAAIQNRIGIVVENHMLKDYKTRVSSNYELLKVICTLLNRDASSLKKLNMKADKYVASKEFREKSFPLSFISTSDSVIVDLEGFEYNVVKSDLTGGNWVQYTNKPTIHKIPVFETSIAAESASLPEAYIFSPEWDFIIDRLDWHGIEYEIIDQPLEMEVETHKFVNPSWGRSPFEGRFLLNGEFEVEREQKTFPAGSVIVKTDQRTARVIAHMFEPGSPDSFIRWGFFNALFEQKEYAETYKMEVMAREMMANNPDLKTEFEQWKLDHPQAASVPWYQLNWFFSQSPYWDQQKNVYPVRRVIHWDLKN